MRHIWLRCAREICYRMSKMLKKKIENRITQAIQEKVFPGCVIGIIKKNKERIVVPFGYFTYENDAPIVQEDSIFDVASITKSIPTASLALKLIDEGKLNLNDKLVDFIPEFRNSARNAVLIKHLLTQTLVFRSNSPEGKFRLSAYKNRSPEEILDIIFTAEFESPPGTKFFYTNATSILLGLVVERIFNESLDKLGGIYFFRPLDMEHTLFEPLDKFPKEEIVPTEIQEWRHGVIQGEVHDESAYTLKQMTNVGSAGLFSTVSDLLTFLEMLLNKGVFNGRRYFSSEIVEQMYTNQLLDIGQCTGLGWELNQPRYMGQKCAETTFGKTGFTGCAVICDIEREIGIVILSNCAFPKRKQDAMLINKLRSDIADLVFETL